MGPFFECDGLRVAKTIAWQKRCNKDCLLLVCYSLVQGSANEVVTRDVTCLCRIEKAKVREE